MSDQFRASAKTMAARVRELANPPSDDYDRAVNLLLDDLDEVWFRCADRIPDRSGIFLVYSEADGQMWVTPFAPFGTRQGDVHERQVVGWYCCRGPEGAQPTHWRPLPLPPTRVGGPE